jgi:hypothetical protein
MLERILYDIVKAGLDWFIAQPARFERWCVESLLLTEEEAEKLRIYFQGQPTASPPVLAKPPHLVHGYARTGGPFPCVSLTLGSEDIATDYLNRDASLLDSEEEYYLDPESGEVVDPKIRRLRYTFNFMIHADHPDVCIVYYHLIKFILMSAHDTLEANDVEDLIFNGRDLAPDPRYLPDDLFTRLLTVTVEGDETWAAPMAQFAKHISGIFHEDAVASVAASGEKANITPYTVEPTP